MLPNENSPRLSYQRLGHQTTPPPTASSAFESTPKPPTLVNIYPKLNQHKQNHGKTIHPKLLYTGIQLRLNVTWVAKTTHSKSFYNRITCICVPVQPICMHLKTTPKLSSYRLSHQITPQ